MDIFSLPLQRPCGRSEVMRACAHRVECVCACHLYFWKRWCDLSFVGATSRTVACIRSKCVSYADREACSWVQNVDDDDDVPKDEDHRISEMDDERERQFCCRCRGRREAGDVLEEASRKRMDRQRIALPVLPVDDFGEIVFQLR